MSGKYIEIKSEKELELTKSLEKRDDFESRRLLRFLNMPDLSRDKSSPLFELAGRIKKIARFSDFDDVKSPDVLPADVSFDLFNFPAEHPARRPTDTYFVDNGHILRTHTTLMWYYWLNQPEVKEKIKNKESVGAVSHGKVYRKDEIDRNHMNVFHQMDGWYLTPKSESIITIDDLKDVLTEIAKTIFGDGVKYRFNKDEFPYTDPSLEMEIEVGDGESRRWVEVLGAGVVREIVLKNLGVDPEEYNGWAFGFGLERLAIISMDLPDIRLFWSEDPRVTKQLRLGNKFVEVNIYPTIVRDITFVIKNDFVPNDYFDLVRETAPDFVEEVGLIDKYEIKEKFGENMVSYAFRITYRSTERTLTSEEIDIAHRKLEKETVKIFKAKIR